MRVEIRLLGEFGVVVDGVPVPASRWSRRAAASLVKALALAPGARMHRDRLVDLLWPDVDPDLAAARLHKATHFARTALGDRAAVTMHDQVVVLFPGAAVDVDVARFERAAQAALGLRPPSPAACDKALDRSAELLPADLAESWLDQPRERVRMLRAQLLRGAGRWQQLLEAEPADEQAHTELLREAVVRGDRTEALRRYTRMERTLHAELGVQPGANARLLREQALALDVDQPRRAPTHVARAAVDLVERDAELDQLNSASRAALDRGCGQVLLVAGEAGSGKTALITALVSGLQSSCRTLTGSCDDLFAARSLGPFRDMAADHLDLDTVLDADRLADALPQILRALATEPTLVVVEDVHWADDATLDVVRYLARRISQVPVALALTFRDTALDPAHPLSQVLGALSGVPACRVMLRPLSVQAIADLGAAPQEAVRIHDVTRGNPFFVTEVLAAPRGEVPPTVRDAVLARLGRLPARVRTFVRRLAVVPTRCERWLAEQLADDDADVILDAERTGVLLGDSDSISFRHELARQAVEMSLVPGERLTANRTVIAALLAHPGTDAARLVHHAHRAGRTDLVLQHGPSVAADAGRLGAHRQAAEVLRVVLESGRDLSDAERGDLSTRRAYSLYVVNQYEDAFACAQSAVAAAERAGDARLLADALLVLARVALFARGPSLARPAATRAVDVEEAIGDRARLAIALTELARAHSNLPTVDIVADTCEAAAEYGERAVAIAQSLERNDIAAQAWCYVGDARSARGAPDAADDLDRAINLAASDSRLETTVRCYVNAAGAAYRAGRLDAALRYAADGLHAAADGEFFAGEYRLRLTRAMVQASRGEWDDAVPGLRRLLATPGEPGVMAVLARCRLARLLARRGDGEAIEVLAEASSHRVLLHDGLVAGELAAATVELGWLDGTLGELTGDVRSALGLAARDGHVALHAEVCAYLVRAAIRVPPPRDPPGPWAATLSGEWQQAASAWAALGERYEHAVILATAPNSYAQALGQRMLEQLGACATLRAT